jgi:hypothetical protein
LELAARSAGASASTSSTRSDRPSESPRSSGAVELPPLLDHRRKEKVNDLKSALDAVQNGQVIPKIDVTQIQLAKQAAAELLGILHQIGAWTASSGAPAIHRELNRSMSDYGVTPGAQ